MRAPWEVRPKSLWEAAAHGPALPIASLAVGVLGTGMSVIGQMQQGKAQRNMALYQQRVAENNIILSQRAAEDATARGKVEEQSVRQRYRQLIGTQRSTMAANGVLVDTGSASDIVEDTAEIGELDALTVRANAERERQFYLAQGMNFQGEAAMHGLTKKNSGGFPWGTLIGGLGSVAEKWYNFDQQGAFK
jgi:hypothetical protein